jgi:hypothetical protein
MTVFADDVPKKKEIVIADLKKVNISDTMNQLLKICKIVSNVSMHLMD